MLVGKSGMFGTYHTEKQISSFWIDPEPNEDLIVEFEYTIQDESFDAYNLQGSLQAYPSYGTKVTNIIGIYGKDTGSDYSRYMDPDSHALLDHLADIVAEDTEV